MGDLVDDDGVCRVLRSAVFACSGRVLVGIDGVDGSGKTTFADSLARYLSSAGRPVVRIGLDDFLNPRAVRHGRGRDSPEGFWLDSYNYKRVRKWVLEPLSLEGSGVYRGACHDAASNRDVFPPSVLAPSDCVVILDGMFLHRNELASEWTLSVFLDVPFSVTAQRMAVRDGSHPDPDHLSMRRYVQGQRLYFAECDPASRATFVVDSSIPARPVLSRGAGVLPALSNNPGRHVVRCGHNSTW